MSLPAPAGALQAIKATPLLRGITCFDLAATALFALPGLSQLFLLGLDALGRSLGLAPALAPFPPLAMFLMNLAGILGVCWNLHLLRHPSWALLKLNIGARLLVAGLIGYYVTCEAVTPVLLLFALTELFGASVEWRFRPAAR